MKYVPKHYSERIEAVVSGEWLATGGKSTKNSMLVFNRWKRSAAFTGPAFLSMSCCSETGDQFTYCRW